MDQQRWNHIARLLDAVLDRPPEEHAAYLDAHCDDPHIRAEVNALLDAEANAPAFLEADAAEVASPLLDKTPDPGNHDATGESIGPYRLVERVGQGGMSVVYRAERADGHFTQQVALKLLPRYFETERRIARFRAERQILAALDHPNIARLLDGGVTEAGRPYLVMEYVDGVPITDYCAARALSLEDRLQLIRSVCDALQHAHRRLIVHRDLKPSNILVTDDGTAKLLDFGIAKLIDAETAPVTVPLTRTGERLMTPEYAAPEQVRGTPITTATDVYQLGVLTYELLTGQRPFRLEGCRLSEIERAILETTPTRPSTALHTHSQEDEDDNRMALPAAPDAWRRRLRGDLDTIVLKALRKEPARRYGSAEALADDLERYLDGRPVDARPATWRYRTKKFVQRHRIGMTLAGTATLLLAVFIIALTHQRSVALQERDRATQEADKAEQVSEFLINLFEASDPNTTRGDTVTARQLLQRGVERAEALDDQPVVQAEMRSVIGRVYMQLGLYESATPLFEQALETRRERLDDVPPAQLAGSLHNLGANYQSLGRYEEAEALYREALPIWRDLSEAEQTDMVRTLNNLAGILRTRGDYDDAVSIQQETLTTARRLLDEEHPLVAFALGNLAEIHHQQGNFQRADSLYFAGWNLGRRVVGADHPNLLSTRSNQAELYRETGRLAQAEALHREVLSIREDRYPDHTVRRGLSETALGHTLRAQHKYDEAEAMYRAALDHLRPNLPDEHVYIADALMGLGATLTAHDRPADAEPLLRNSLAIYAEQQPDGWQIAEVQSFLGHCLSRQGRYDEAEPLLLDGHATLAQQRGPDDGYTRRAARHLAALYIAWGKPEEAAAYRPANAN